MSLFHRLLEIVTVVRQECNVLFSWPRINLETFHKCFCLRNLNVRHAEIGFSKPVENQDTSLLETAIAGSQIWTGKQVFLLLLLLSHHPCFYPVLLQREAAAASASGGLLS
jgi:hypothetical protein